MRPTAIEISLSHNIKIENAEVRGENRKVKFCIHVLCVFFYI